MQSADEPYERAKAMLAAGDPAGRAALEACAQAGEARACFRLAGLRAGEAGGFDADGLALLRQAAGTGHARAAFQLGLLYAQGRAGSGPDLDLAVARRWCEQAAGQGLAVAQFNLGLLGAADPATDPREAERWLRLAAANGIPEADACLAAVRGQADGVSPRTWDDAETRASVALARSDPDAPKSVRFAEYYLDPCLDLLARRLALRREESEDIVQQFFLEMEMPLAKGAQAGVPWKEALRRSFDPQRGNFRAFLGRTLVNFVRDWQRRQHRARTASPDRQAGPLPDPESLRDAWGPELERFRRETTAVDPATTRAIDALLRLVVAQEDRHQQAVSQAVNERTVRRDLHHAGGLLQEWVARQIGDARTADAVSPGLRRGLEMIPDWLFRITPDKRARLLCFLAVLHRLRRRLEARQGDERMA